MITNMMNSKLDEPLIDVVNSPSHYTQNKMEVIDILENSMSKEHFIGYLRGNIFKYVLRYDYKNGKEDLGKAAWYLDRLTKTTT